MTFRRRHVIIIKCEESKELTKVKYTEIDVCELQKCNYSKTRACQCLFKEFGANRVTLSVKFWCFLPDQEHFKYQAFKLAPAFLKNFEILTQVRRSQIVFVLEMFTAYGMFMFFCTLMEVAARVTWCRWQTLPRSNIKSDRLYLSSTWLRTMLDHARRLSSTPDFFLQECKNLKEIFLKLKYPEKLINSTISSFQHPPDVSHVPAIRQPPAERYAIQGSEICWRAENFVTLGERSITICSQFYHQKDHWPLEMYGIEATYCKPTECCVRIYMCFVRWKLYRLHVPPPPSLVQRNTNLPQSVNTSRTNTVWDRRTCVRIFKILKKCRSMSLWFLTPGYIRKRGEV